MLIGEVIDLCLTTDDEKTKRRSGATRPWTNNKPHSSSGSQPLNIEGELRKKRKLSSLSRQTAEEGRVANHAPLAKIKSSLPTVKASDYFISIDDDDSTVWTFSPKQKPKASTRPGSHHQPGASLSDSDASLPDEAWLRTAQSRPVQVQHRVKQTANPRSAGEKNKYDKERSEWRNESGCGSSIEPPLHLSRSEQSRFLGEGSTHTAEFKAPKGRKPKPTHEEKVAQARANRRAKAAAKALRLQEHELLKEQKRLLKEEQSREKQKEKDRADANKLRLDKKLSTPEMIVDLPISIDGSTVDTQTRECLKNIGVEITSYQSLVPNVIKWRRNVDSRFNSESGLREKLRAREIDLEKHVMCLMSAKDFVQLATSDANDSGLSLDDHVSQISRILKDGKPIYLIEGLDAWMRKNRNAKNRAHQAAVLGQPDLNAPEVSGNGPNPAPRRRKPKVVVVDEDMIEDALLRLQIMNSCLVHHTATTVETAEWVAHFTEQISQIPYRYEQTTREATFCMDSGQVKCGKDAEETYINMLLANVRITGPIAYGIAARYPKVVNLLEGLEEKGPTALEHLKVVVHHVYKSLTRKLTMPKKSANKDGSLGERNIGPAISRRLHKVLTDADPSSTDI
ncbi:MAG: hypothetical protein Q9172_002858 [Xanthocarpia lactea]